MTTTDKKKLPPDVEAPSATAAAVIKTVEAWATEKGMLPPFVDGARMSPRLPPNQVRNPDYWKFAAARAFKAWPEGRELTESDFDAAVDAAINTTHQ